MMTSPLVLMLVLAVHSLTLSGSDGLKFYLVPDFSINGSVFVGDDQHFHCCWNGGTLFSVTILTKNGR
ncbi:MAG: hypothetical protein ACLURV_01375 [Gallintestinimicrobium sp.]